MTYKEIFNTHSVSDKAIDLAAELAMEKVDSQIKDTCELIYHLDLIERTGMIFYNSQYPLTPDECFKSIESSSLLPNI